MNLKKALFASGLILVLTIGLSTTQVLAVEPVPPNNQEIIIGPQMWAVGVVDCGGASVATLRVKKIEDCNVDTDPQTQSVTGCPANEADILYQRLATGSVFSLPCEPIITKVKNFKTDGNLVSFDAQIQFLTTDPSKTECTP